MHNKIAIEEAWNMPDQPHPGFGAPSYSGANQKIGDILHKELCDIHEIRLRKMDECGVEFQVLSFTSPGPQGQSNKAKAEELARRANDTLAAEVKKCPARFGAFASLSMHDPVQAGQELERCVKDYGFLGAILNDFQNVNEDAETMQFYDQPMYDPFWKKAVELDVPVYLHPRTPIPSIAKALYGQRPWLNGAALGFANQLNVHIAGLCVNGVFDRFPDLKVICGHMGEHLPYDLARTGNRLEMLGRSRGMPMKHDIHYYWGKNIVITTSGHYSTPSLICAMQQIGLDACMFSIDYPYEPMEPGCKWFDDITEGKLALTKEEQHKIGRANAIRILKLKLDP